MPLQATSGAASYDAFGGGVPFVPNYIEDVFSCFVYTGTSAARDIVNGIDLAGKGGLAWIKCRTVAESNSLFTTNLGANKTLLTNATDAQDTVGTDVFQAFNSDGFRVGNHGRTNESPRTYVSWTFRKQPKFFDVVTFTQSGTSGWQTVNHSLGSVPGCIIFKNTTRATSWPVYHRYDAAKKLILDSTSAEVSETIVQNLTSTSFEVSITNIGNNSGDVFVAYIFAHNAGGFGLTGTDNVISCGSFTTDGSGNATVNLGYEPQWFLAKKSSGTGNWFLVDTMRKFTASNSSGADTASFLFPNTSDAEAGGDIFRLNSTGVNVGTGVASDTYIYIAIRRGPMKVPTDATKVFSPFTYTGDGASTRTFNIGLNPVDMVWQACRSSADYNFNTLTSRLQGGNGMTTAGTGAEFVSNQAYDLQTGIRSTGFENTLNQSGQTFVMEGFRRAPSFFDEVCYTGTGSARTVTHNLGAVPELMIMKNRSTTGGWYTYAASLGASNALQLNLSDAALGFGYWNNTAPTASVFSTGAGSNNDSGVTYVAYLFATCAGVSKVGSYTGNGSSQTINCGFTGGARFVMVKRTDSTGDWLVYDSARGIVSGNDPVLKLNNTDAESSFLDTVDTDSTGFIVNQNAFDANASGGTYIFLAIA